MGRAEGSALTDAGRHVCGCLGDLCPWIPVQLEVKALNLARTLARLLQAGDVGQPASLSLAFLFLLQEEE